MSVADRIAALQKQGNGNAPPPLSTVTKPKAGKNNALADRIAALQKNAESTTNGAGGDEVPKAEKPKVGKLKPPPAGAVPIIPFGSGPPPSLLKKQKEREEKMEKLKQEASTTDEPGDDTTTKEVGKVKPPPGAIPIMPFGAGIPPSMLKKQKEREEKMASLKKEAEESQTTEESVDDDALISRPTIKGGKRRPRTRGTSNCDVKSDA